ncbi:hypothetical protein ABI59_18100 [Acidobacteria bacterium Mor1]|nr:hypothetical protein ABI59_18100 [Acidobacteria bacterium Mor1]
MLLFTAMPGLVFAQGRGDYYNVESPQVHPIEVARIGGHDYILAVNTPDNSLEIWDTDETIPVSSRLVSRVRTGLEPVSVTWVPEMDRAYVANFLGDSITSVHLAPGDSGRLSVTLDRTAQVTDEPLHMAFAEIDVEGTLTPVLFVTHMTLDALGKYHARTLQPIAMDSDLIDLAVPSGADLDFDTQLDDIAIKEPRTPAIACDTLWVLGHKGGNTVRYDFDLYSEHLTTGVLGTLGGLGSTNAEMTFASDDTLYVVGGMARNTELFDEANVAAANTGFFKHMIWEVKNLCSGNPTIRGRDVNLRKLAQPIERNATSAPLDAEAEPLPTTGPFGKNKSLARLTSVVPYENGGSVSKVFFTAMSSDRIGVIVPTAQAPINWKIRRINVSPVDAPIAGPRGLALKDASGSAGDPGERLYVLNRVDNSITIIDPVAETVVDSFDLSADPTPDYITDGRRFLYDAKLSGNGKVTCESCHTDGRTDGLAWDLGDPSTGDLPIPRELMPNDGFANGVFPADKSFMVTQSLQGLLNWEVGPDDQDLFTNAPYHWRGDRETFVAFQGAFESLLGADEPLPTPEMEQFEEFINSVHYPPNPKQPRERVHSGTLGDPDDNDTTQSVSGTGALAGLKIYTTAAADIGRACVGCHAFPEGSDNVMTEDFPGVDPHNPLPQPPLVRAPSQPIETAALRLLFQKEARLDRDGDSRPWESAITGYEGVLHTGLDISRSADFNGTASMNAFNLNFFGPLCGGGQPGDCDNVLRLNQFVQEFDTGTGPMVGRTHTVTTGNSGSTETMDALQDMREQAELANAGYAVQAFLGAGARGFWYDLSVHPGVFREEPSGAAFTETQLLGLLTSPRERLVLLAVPLGSERRVAVPKGDAPRLVGDPAAIELLPMVTNTAYRDVPSLTNLVDNNGAPGFNGTHGHTVRLYQHGLLNNPSNEDYGLCELRHEPARRFRVSGKNIQHGAQLHLWVQDDPNNGPPITTLGPEDVGQVQMRLLELPIHPTVEEDADGHIIWETAAEMEALLFLRLMAGRIDQNQFPGTMVGITELDFLQNVTTENQTGLFDPDSWNAHYVRVVNPDGSKADQGWAALRIEPGTACP